MENKKDEKPGLTDQLREYIETRVELVRLQAIEMGTSFAAGLATEIFVLGCITITILFFSITVALFLGSLLGAYWLGFGCVTLVYLLTAIIISAYKKRYIEPRIVNFLIKRIFRQKNNEENGNS